MEVGETGKGKLTAAFVHMVNDMSSKRLKVEDVGEGKRTRRWWTTSMLLGFQ